MPTPVQVAERIDPVTGPFAFVRLIGDRESIEKITTTWDKIVVDRSAELAESARVIAALARRVPVVVFANNHYAGHGPATVRALRALLGLPEPVPPAAAEDDLVRLTDDRTITRVGDGNSNPTNTIRSSKPPGTSASATGGASSGGSGWGSSRWRSNWPVTVASPGC